MSVFPAKKYGEECWLSSLHTLYEENLQEIETQLKLCVDRLSPDVGFVTCHARVQDRALSVQPFSQDLGYASHFLPKSQLIRCSRYAPELTEFRRRIAGRLKETASVKDSEFQMAINYLSQPVPWQPRDPVSLVYIRQTYK